MFSLQAGHSFCQWQCVLRDAIVLNYTLLEPVPSPHSHEVFCGTLAQSLHGELQKGNIFEDHYCCYLRQLSAHVSVTIATVVVGKKRMMNDYKADFSHCSQCYSIKAVSVTLFKQ